MCLEYQSLHAHRVEVTSEWAGPKRCSFKLRQELSLSPHSQHRFHFQTVKRAWWTSWEVYCLTGLAHCSMCASKMIPPNCKFLESYSFWWSELFNSASKLPVEEYFHWKMIHIDILVNVLWSYETKEKRGMPLGPYLHSDLSCLRGDSVSTLQASSSCAKG